LERSRALVGDWVQGADRFRGQDLAQALAELSEPLLAHLDEEERVILPLCAAHLSAPEWGELPAHGLGSFRGDKVWLILGLIRENMTEDQRNEMLAHMPPPAVQMWTSMGSSAFDAFVAELRR
jgi:hypothetical protein